MFMSTTTLSNNSSPTSQLKAHKSLQQSMAWATCSAYWQAAQYLKVRNKADHRWQGYWSGKGPFRLSERSSQPCTFFRSTQNSTSPKYLSTEVMKGFWRMKAWELELPGIAPVTGEAQLKSQQNAAIGGNSTSYEFCFHFFCQTQIHMLPHFSSLCNVIYVACCLTMHKVCPYEASQVHLRMLA